MPPGCIPGSAGIQKLPGSVGIQKLPNRAGIQKLPCSTGIQKLPMGIQKLPGSTGIQKLPDSVGIQKLPFLNNSLSPMKPRVFLTTPSLRGGVGTKGVKPTDTPTEAPTPHKKVSWWDALFPRRPLVDVDS
jgi:hypothetical protein